jgi:hypothetical protein
MTYSEKLRDPRWQKKRLEILNRDCFECVLCGDKETELHIHHKKYNGDPWEAKDEDLQVLCKHCHLLIETLKKTGAKIQGVIKRKELMYDDVFSFDLFVKICGFVIIYKYCRHRNILTRESCIDYSDMQILNKLIEWQDL